MSCERYNGFQNNSLLKTDEPVCRFQKECSKNIGDCKFGRIISTLDNYSKSVCETPDDLEQNNVLAELEQKHKQSPTIDEILEDMKQKSLISISRVNQTHTTI